MEEQEPAPENPEHKKLFANSLTTTILIFEGLIGLAGVGAGIWAGVNWGYFLVFRPHHFLLGVAGGFVMFAIHLILMFPGGEKNPLFRLIYKPFAKVMLKPLQTLSFEDIVLISLMSGFGEELMFRGFLQTRFGLVIASLLFGFIHIWGKQAFAYALYAVAMGFFLGGLFLYTNNLWAPIAAHVINNLLGLLIIKLNYAPEVS